MKTKEEKIIEWSHKNYPEMNPHSDYIQGIIKLVKAEARKEFLDTVDKLIKKEKEALRFGKSLHQKETIRRTNKYIEDKLLLFVKIKEDILRELEDGGIK